MPNHIYQPGDLVERISTGERATFSEAIWSEWVLLLNVSVSCGLGDEKTVYWPAADCRPAVDHATPEFGCVRDMEKELRAMRQTLVEISEMKIPYCDANDVANYMRDAAKESLRAAAEGEEL